MAPRTSVASSPWASGTKSGARGRWLAGAQRRARAAAAARRSSPRPRKTARRQGPVHSAGLARPSRRSLVIIGLVYRAEGPRGCSGQEVFAWREALWIAVFALSDIPCAQGAGATWARPREGASFHISSWGSAGAARERSLEYVRQARRRGCVLQGTEGQRTGGPWQGRTLRVRDQGPHRVARSRLTISTSTPAEPKAGHGRDGGHGIHQRLSEGGADASLGGPRAPRTPGALGERV